MKKMPVAAALWVGTAAMLGVVVPAHAVLDLDNVSISITRFLPADTYQIQLDAEGFDLTSATVTPPVGPAVALTCVSPPFADCSYFEEFPTLAALETKFPMGSYLFSFNGGSSSIALAHRGFVAPADADAPAAYSPDLGGTCTSTTPSFSWTCAGGCASSDALELQLVGSGGEVFNASFVPPTGGTVSLPSGPFVPPPTDLEGGLAALVPGEDYTLSTSTEDQLSSVESIGADSFGYGDDSKVDTLVALSADCVVPAASSPWLFLLVAVLAASPLLLRMPSRTPAA